MSSMLIEREPLDVVTAASETAGEGPRAQLSVREMYVCAIMSKRATILKYRR